tara:strand:- start:2599 stop:3675 length:1077 start_codon:yes stop_codon:yes gene_type:complete
MKIAFIKFGGMAAGGTEKFLQTIASHLPKDKFEVDYFYTNGAPYIGSDHRHLDTDPTRVEYCKAHGVNCIPVHVGHKNVTVHTHDWIRTNLWDLFDEKNYDLVVSGRSGHPEYPFNLIFKTPIIDTIHLSGMAENKSNTYKTVLMSEEQRGKWIQAGGPSEKSMVIPPAVEIPEVEGSLEFKDYNHIFGMHQRENDGIFSDIPLLAYAKVESSDTMFLMLGGGNKYKNQAEQLGIKNIKFYPATGDVDAIHKFLNTLTVYAHGRKDGEQCSSAIIEAMSHGLPVISHSAPSMGQAAQIGLAGAVVDNSDEYAAIMKMMMEDQEKYDEFSDEAKRRYDELFSMNAIIDKYVKLFEEAVC